MKRASLSVLLTLVGCALSDGPATDLGSAVATGKPRAGGPSATPSENERERPPTDAATEPSTPPRAKRTAPQALPVADGFYPRVIQRTNGTVVASVVRFLPSGRMGAAIFESKDEGLSFQELGAIDDPINAGGLCCGTLYELPRAVGALGAGTLLWSASAGGDTPNAPMFIPVWKSEDGGRTWTFLSRVATASKPRRNGGLWEPEFSLLDDGTLACHWSDETDGGHSQKLVVARTSDGITWRDQHDTVALAAFGSRPGMPNIRRSPGGPFVMSYEICALPGDSCTTFVRTSSDGWSWGAVTDRGIRVTTHDGKHLRHAPTLAWAGGGRFLLVGQMQFDGNGAVSRENGTQIFVSPEGGTHAWYTVPAPVPVPEAFDNFCPNYSSSLLPLENGTVALQLASKWDGNVCKTYFARGPLVDTSDGSEIADGRTYRLVSAHSGLCVDVAGGTSTEGGDVIQYTCTGGPAQRWKVARTATGAITLRADVSGLLLTAPSTNGPGDVVQTSAGTAWNLRAMGTGYYELRREGTNTCLDVAGGSTAPGGNVAEWTCNDLAPQIWKLEAL